MLLLMASCRGPSTSFDDLGYEPPSVEGEYGWQVDGDATVGYRFVRVDGNEDQYDADVNLQDGPRLLGLNVAAREQRVDGEENRFRLSASGIGDPVADVDGEYRHGDTWRARVDFTRTDFVFAGFEDLHPMDQIRRNFLGELEWTPDGAKGARFGLRYLRSEREGDVLFTRFIEGDVLFPDRTDQDRTLDSVAAFTSFETGEVLWTIEAELLQDHLSDDRNLDVPSPQNPAVNESQDFRSTNELQGPVFLARAETEVLGGQGHLDATVRYSHLSSDGDFTSVESGIGLGGDLYVEDASGNSDAERERFDFEIGFDVDLDEHLTLFGSYELSSTKESGDVVVTEIRQEPPGSPPLVATERANLDVDVVRHGLAAELEWDLDEVWSLRGGIELERSYYDLDEAAIQVDDTYDAVTPLLSIRYEPSREFRAELTTERESADETFNRIDPGRVWRSRFQMRYRWSEEMDATVTLRHEQLENSVADADATSFGSSLFFRYQPRNEVGFTAKYSYLHADTTYDTQFFVGTALTDGETEFVGRTHVFAPTMEIPLTERLSLAVGGSLSDAGGSSDFIWQRWGGTIEFAVSPSLAIGTKADWYGFNGREALDPYDYDAGTLLLYLRAAF